MLLQLNPAESSGIWNVIPKVATAWNLAAFALAVVLYLVMKSRRREISFAALGVIVLLVAIPIVASVYSELLKRTAIYRVRVTVIGPQGTPLEDAKVWSSFGGEPKRVAGGWQFDIPDASRPSDGKLILFAGKPSAFLVGKVDLTLGNDLNPAVTISLARDNSATVRGQVVDGTEQAVAGARVFVVGYETEAVVTGKGGNFELRAHTAQDEPVLLYAEKDGLAIKQWHASGDYAAILKLAR